MYVFVFVWIIFYNCDYYGNLLKIIMWYVLFYWDGFIRGDLLIFELFGYF